jgi:hypothetical protein
MGAPLPPDGAEAARWLRDNSAPDDLVATNLHCLPDDDPDRCDARHFWVSAYAERRVLVEGWAYTESAFRTALKLGVSDRTVPFWDPALLAANDLAFTSPSNGVAELRDRYHVEWLFADLRQSDASGLAAVASERYRSGPYAVFEVR